MAKNFTAEQRAKHARDVAACQKRNREAGLCSCGRPPGQGFKKCSTCRERIKRRIEAKKTLGICTRCKASAEPGHTLCGKHRQEISQRTNKLRRTVRAKALEAYGNRCACCGESRREFLTIDHVGGTGAAHRRLLKVISPHSATNISWWLQKNGYPEGFRVLCWNCNCAIGIHGACPHDAELATRS
ncbi:MAG: hypothetical protein K2X82_30160 [Gemmataceae bacterium]|nr:hypothetical protein [Gemmataceae bacterium]